jgi:hypothetical protein
MQSQADAAAATGHWQQGASGTIKSSMPNELASNQEGEVAGAGGC